MTPPPRPLAALCAVADVLGRAGVRWLLAGSAGRALLGAPVRPGDIDLEVEAASADAASRALGAGLAETSGGGRSSRWGSAYRAGVEIDLTSDLVVEGPGGRLGPDFAMQWEWSHAVTTCGRTIRVAPAEEAMVRAIVLGDWAGVAKVAGRAAPERPLRPAYVAARLSSASASATR